jgi:hypothetical protein
MATYENGWRAAEIKGICESLAEMKKQLAGIDEKLNGHLLSDANVRAHIKVLWAAAAVYGVTILGLALKALFFSGCATAIAGGM